MLERSREEGEHRRYPGWPIVFFVSGNMRGESNMPGDTKPLHSANLWNRVSEHDAGVVAARFGSTEVGVVAGVCAVADGGSERARPLAVLHCDRVPRHS